MFFSSAYHTLLETLGNKIDKTQGDINHLTTIVLARLDALASNRIVPDVNPFAQRPNIPLNPERERYPLVRWWDKDRWLAIKAGRTENNSNSAINSIFLEDERGFQISPELQLSLLGDVRGRWNDLRDEGSMPGPWRSMGFTIKEDFRKAVEGKYPFLRLCEGHWKIGQLWSNNFTSWERLQTIIISSDDDQDPVGGSAQKRSHVNDGNAESSKKHKGEGATTSNFHPPGPRSKGKARIGRVSNSSPLLRHACLLQPFI
jgi:hypothetical protein